MKFRDIKRLVQSDTGLESIQDSLLPQGSFSQCLASEFLYTASLLFLFCLGSFLAMLRGLWDLNFLTRDGTPDSAVKVQSGPLDHQGIPNLASWPTRIEFWRRQWHPTPVLLPGRRSLAGYSPWGH